MLLDNSLYKITYQNYTSQFGEFELALDKNHIIYQSHFPGHPVTPGVIQLQIITELCGKYFDKKIRLNKIQRSKFLKVINPEINFSINVKLSLNTIQTETEVEAIIFYKEEVFTTAIITIR